MQEKAKEELSFSRHLFVGFFILARERERKGGGLITVTFHCGLHLESHQRHVSLCVCESFSREV